MMSINGKHSEVEKGSRIFTDLFALQTKTVSPSPPPTELYDAGLYPLLFEKSSG